MPVPVLSSAPALGAPATVLACLVSGGDAPRPARGVANVLRAAGAPAEEVLVAHLGRAPAAGRAGSVLEVPVPEGALRRVLLVGTGDGGSAAMRRAGAAVGRATRADTGPLAVAGLGGVSGEAVRAFAEGLALAAYAVPKAGAARARPLEVTLVGAYPEALRRAEVTAGAVHLARDLANTPSSTKSPQWLAEQAVAAAASAGLRVRVRDEHELADEGFGGILAVGSGSVRPPRLVELGYSPGGRVPHLVLIGKGITFDSGGISLKPAESMVAMKTDMAGAGAVLAVLAALPRLGIRARVTGLLACAENMPSGSAMRPSDVIRHYGGRTSEVLNTDAEGRLVLADALAYADARLRPDAMIDIATLTGAVSIALGRRDAALFATRDALARALERAGEASGERVWRMPFVEDYRPAVDSDVADLSNVAAKPARFSAGTILAALFLREFAGDRPWAHLDIAGTGRSDADTDELTRGATGYGVRLLLRWLESLRV
ncbi:MAG TPA: leucyl aminopeptidase [Actinomycetes bacterium]|nr:leucyl aminopeptidase [Actinomycetes bacterium]